MWCFTACSPSSGAAFAQHPREHGHAQGIVVAIGLKMDRVNSTRMANLNLPSETYGVTYDYGHLVSFVLGWSLMSKPQPGMSEERVETSTTTHIEETIP